MFICKKNCLRMCVTLLLISAIALIPASCGGHRHSGRLIEINVQKDGLVPCGGVFICGECGEEYTAQITLENAGIPVIKVEGSLEGISKENKVNVEISYDGRTSFKSKATLKWQGESTLVYPKKNYSVQFLNNTGEKNKVLISDAWGKQSKYCLKANWEDWAGCRNLVSAALWGDTARSRQPEDILSGLVNAGAVDGFPVLLFVNGGFEGLYTLNSPKDEWIFGMSGSGKRQGLLFAEEWSDSTLLKEPITDVNDPESSGFEVEFCSTQKDPDGNITWLSEGMNALIAFIRDNDGESFVQGIGEYTDVGRVIDYIVFDLLTAGADNTGRNIIWATYDGKKYIPSVYDLDSTWGGTTEKEKPVIQAWASGGALRENLLFKRFFDNFTDEIISRYAELRHGALSEENVRQRFSEYLETVPEAARKAEEKRWPKKYNNADDCLSGIMTHYKTVTEALDAYFATD